MLSPPPTTTHGGATSISDIHPDIIKSHILTKLDGPSLATAASSSLLLHRLCTETKLWSDLCTATWPSSAHPRVQSAISTFPSGHRSYFSNSFPTLDHHLHRRTPPPPPPHSEEIIFAVDLHYKKTPIFSKVEVTETNSDWFLNSPFRVDLLDPKETIPTRIKFENIEKDLTLSWVLIHPTRKRSVNLSSMRPVSVTKHWLTSHVHVTYDTILSRDHKCDVEVVLGGEGSVCEVSMRVENVEGDGLNGRGTLVILVDGILGRKMMKDGEERERYEEYLGIRRERGGREEERKEIGCGLCFYCGNYLCVILELCYFKIKIELVDFDFRRCR